MNLLLVWTVIFAVAFVILRRFRRAYSISKPKLGMLDLTGGLSDCIVAEDRAVLSRFFPTFEESKSEVPKCDVLFLYATLNHDGTLQNTGHYLRAYIRDAGAKVAVLASENPNPKWEKGRATYGRANLVITIARNGPAFPRFFSELFAQMGRGRPMPMAWVKLAPQIPNHEHPDCPDTIFLCEVGGITFR
jgi:hypothetical protein